MNPLFPRDRAEDAASFLLRRAKEKGAAAADVLYSFRSGQSLSVRWKAGKKFFRDLHRHRAPNHR